MDTNYKQSVCCLLAMWLIATVSLQAQPTPPPGFMWEAVPALTDEFDAWDNTKWRKVLWNYGVPVQMRAENSGVEDGNLWIKATLDQGAERWFETSRVMSKTKINYPMYTECRMKTAHISAYNTFWLNNGDIDNRDEIDVVENNSKPSCGCQPEYPWQMNSQYFHADQQENPQTIRNADNFDNRTLSANNPLKGIPWNEAYHVVGVWWKDSVNIQFYLDGEPAGRVKVGDHWDGTKHPHRKFTRDLDIIWDLWTIDAMWSGGIAAQNDLLDDSINTMKVDWIHTYKLVIDPTTSVRNQDVPAVRLEVYPNPTTGQLNMLLQSPVEPDATVQVYSQFGQLLIQEPLTQQRHQLTLEDLPAGMYGLKVSNGGVSTFRKFIKE